MHSHDPVDDALRTIARVDASHDFAATVRARIEASRGRRAARWPVVVATACSIVAVVGLAVWMQRAPATPPIMSSRVPMPQSAVAEPSTGAIVADEPRSVTTRRAGARMPAAGLRRVGRADHERALATLGRIETLAVAEIPSDLIAVPPLQVDILAEPAPLSLTSQDAGESGGGEH